MAGDHEGHAYTEYMPISGMLITRVDCIRPMTRNGPDITENPRRLERKPDRARIKPRLVRARRVNATPVSQFHYHTHFIIKLYIF